MPERLGELFVRFRVVAKLVLVAAIVFAIAAIGWFAWLGYGLPWTGFGDYVEPTLSPGTQFVRGKTLWDWMQLLVVPLVLAVGAVAFNWVQQKTERAISFDNQQETALQDYLDQMTYLILEKKLATPDADEAHDIARARTLTVLRRLDGSRRGVVIRFLGEAKLIQVDSPIIAMSGALLEYCSLAGSDLDGVDLSETKLDNAELASATLARSCFRRAKLNLANLSMAILKDANLHSAKLAGARLRSADLTRADLRATDLRRADLRDADLTEAKLGAADLCGANLTGANVDDDQLLYCKLDGAKMPDGDKFRKPRG